MYKILLLMAAALLTACSQTTELKRPALPVPGKWQDSSSGLSNIDAAKTHWRSFFSDPRLQALIETALENNRDLRIAAARVEEARAQFRIAQADKIPTVNVGRGPGAPVAPGVVAPLAGISYEVDFWGRISGLNASARYSYLATEEARRSVQLTLIADVASAYFELLRSEELVMLLGATVELRERSLDLIGKGRDLGATYAYEVQQASGILESTRASLAAQELQRSIANNRLEFLVGRVGSALPPGRFLEDQLTEVELATGVPGEVLLLRPDVMASEQRLKAAHANIGVARTAFFPRVVISAGLGLLGGGIGGLFNMDSASINPLVSFPALFDGGRNEGNVEVLEARKTIAVAEYERTIQIAFREVADQLAARASLINQMRATQANAKAQEMRLKIAQARYNGGLIGYLEVLDGQRELLAAQQTATNVRRAQLEATVQLYKALGGGEQSEKYARAN
jgi:outer membrane protein, multidrug efflux system